MNTPNTNDFSAAKVGDRVWVRGLDYEGYGIVKDIAHSNSYPIEVSFRGEIHPYERIYDFNYSGEYYSGGPQCLFWDKPEIIAPPRPKRMVKKVVEVRPFKRTDGEIDLAFSRDFHISFRYCGPVQQVEILIEED